MSNVVHIYTLPILEIHQRDHVTNYINVDSKKNTELQQAWKSRAFFFLKDYLKHEVQRLVLLGITVVGSGVKDDFD